MLFSQAFFNIAFFLMQRCRSGGFMSIEFIGKLDLDAVNPPLSHIYSGLLIVEWVAI